MVPFFTGIGQVGYEVILAVAPIVILFALMNFLSFKLRKKRFFDIMKGFLITTIGLILFLHGVNIAYVPVGQHLGSAIASLANNQILIPLGFVMGFLVGFAEPAIHVALISWFFSLLFLGPWIWLSICLRCKS